MTLLERLVRWWYTPRFVARPLGRNVNPSPTYERPPVPPGQAFGGYQPVDRGQRPPKAPPKDPSGFKLNGDRTAAVATDYFWNEDMQACPRGVKVQLLGQGGVAVYGTYSGSDFWTAWAPCPKRR